MSILPKKLNFMSSPSHKEGFSKIDKNVEVWTPPKKLGLASKTMSATHLGNRSSNQKMKRNKKKVDTTVKKKEMDIKVLER